VQSARKPKQQDDDAGIGAPGAPLLAFGSECKNRVWESLKVMFDVKIDFCLL
jgi:hypothetical protein